MKEKTVQLILQNMEDVDDILKIRLVEWEYPKTNLAKILKKLIEKKYQIKKIRLRDFRILDVLKVKTINQKLIMFETNEGKFRVNLEKSKNYVLNNIFQIFDISNNCLYLNKEIRAMKHRLIGVIINSELIIQNSDKVNDIRMNLIALRGLRQKISIQGILIKDHDNIKVELVSGIGVRLEPNRKYLVFHNKSSKFKFLVNDKLTKNLSLTWEYLFGYLK